MSSLGPNSAGTGANDTAVGTVAWSNPGNITASDNSRATASIGVGATSKYLKGTNFGFAVPSSTVDGILGEIERSNANNGIIRDSAVKIVLSGTVSGTNMGATGTTWPIISADAYASYGGSTNLWGTTPTYTDANASTTGMVISATKTGGKVANTAQVDHMRLTWYYTAAVAAAGSGWFWWFWNSLLFVSFPWRNWLLMRRGLPRLNHYTQSAQTRDSKGGRYFDPVASVLNAMAYGQTPTEAAEKPAAGIPAAGFRAITPLLHRENNIFAQAFDSLAHDLFAAGNVVVHGDDGL